MADNRSSSDALDALATKVAEAKKAREALERPRVDRTGMSLGLRMASEFASAILVGGLLGYAIDFLAKSSPWALLIGLGLGFAAGTTNLVRVSKAHAAAHPADPAAGPAVRDDEDDD
jgi:ATP synthase protein I